MPVTAKIEKGKQRKDKQGRPVWRIRIWHEGARHETLLGGTKAEATREEARWRLELEAGARKPRKPAEAVDLLTFSRSTYAEHAMAHLAKSTWAIRRFKLTALCKVLGGLALTEITTERVEAYKAARLEQGRAAETINGEVAALSAVLGYARDLGLPVASPKMRLLTKRGRGRVKAWTREQAAKLLATVEEQAPSIFSLVLFLAYTGCRKGEALACETSWIDLEHNVLRIEPNDDWRPKDNEPREVPIEPALRPWLVKAAQSGRRHAFVSRNDERYAFFPRRLFDKAMSAAGLEGSPHKLRHTYASIFLAGGGSMFALSRILGHASIRTTEKVYGHMLPEALDGARGLVNFGPAVGPATLEARKRWATK